MSQENPYKREEKNQEPANISIQQAELPALSISLTKQEHGMVTTEINLMAKGEVMDECIRGMEYLFAVQQELNNGGKPKKQNKGEYVG
jgi:hypothetical protein|tara:strand:- start:1093 stop:1356 length:264 start_codon:yes stop_codon:yes gene_type:complete